jgi:hypothetical protein
MPINHCDQMTNFAISPILGSIIPKREKHESSSFFVPKERCSPLNQRLIDLSVIKE